MALTDAELIRREKEIVLQLLHQAGIIAFDPEGCILDPEVEELIRGGRQNENLN